MDQVVRIQCNWCHMAQDDHGQERCENISCNAVIRPQNGGRTHYTIVHYTPAVPPRLRRRQAEARV